MGPFFSTGRAAAVLAVAVAWAAQTAVAGYNRPSYIDGCRSANGRYEIVAEAKVRGATAHGPHEWEFIWKDTQTGATQRMPAQGVHGGLIYGQLFIAPDGETFALWNHIVQYWPVKSESQTHHALPAFEQPGEEEKFRGHDMHKKRLIIYRKDGSILKEFGAADFLTGEEWGAVKQIFTMIEWLSPYEGMDKKTPYRVQYSFYRVSPDYTVLEFQPVPAKKSTGRQRVVRVSLTDGRVFAPDEEITDPAKIPVRPFIGEKSLPKRTAEWVDSYVPSLDPVRKAGEFRIVSLAEAYPVAKARPVKPVTFGEVKRLAQGYEQADTPSFVEKFAGRKEPSLLFADNKRKQLFRCGLGTEAAAELISSEASRGRIGPDGRTFYGLHGGRLAAWALTDSTAAQPVILCEKAANDRDFSINDLAISSRGIVYFTTLKDPEKGRLSAFDPRTGKVTVVFDGEQEENLHNPNGIAIDGAERFLFVGISSYKNPGRAGVYCFPIREDGSIDVATGRQAAWLPVKADGIAVLQDTAGDVFLTTEGKIECFDVYGRSRGHVAVPKGTGTNLCLGPNIFDKTIYFTTWDALYSVKVR
jgi:sugar lactone lactonase YvrE